MNPMKGSVSMSVTEAMSSSRFGFSPQLASTDNSWLGSSPFGLGWKTLAGCKESIEIKRRIFINQIFIGMETNQIVNPSFQIIITGGPSVLNTYLNLADTVRQIEQQRNALIANDWDVLENLANQGIGEGYRLYREVRRDLGVLQSALEEAYEGFLQMLRHHAKDKETREEYFSKLRQELLKIRPDLSKEVLDALDALGKGKTSKNIFLNAFLDVGHSENEKFIELVTNTATAQSVRSLMALTFTHFNRHYEVLSGYNFDHHGSEFRDALEKVVDQFQRRLELGIKKIHNDLVNGFDPKGAAEELASDLEESLPAFGRAQATIHHYALFLKTRGKGGVSEKVGYLAAKAGDLTRSAFASYAATFFLSLQCKAVHKSKKGKILLDQASKLAYDIDLPNGKNVEISKISELLGGEYIEIGGFVESITIGKDNDEKLITQVTLRDPSSNSSVVAAAVFVHLRHIGLVEGAFCHLSGIWRLQSGLNKGNPAIEIEKLAINNLAKKSWKIKFQDSVDKFIDRWPGGLNIRYGLSPHHSIAEKPTKSKILGAGELIFKPIYKSK